jgi:uncharacterized membrane protein
MVPSIRPSVGAFAAAMAGLGLIALICGNSAEIWAPIPAALPGRPVIIGLCGLVELATGVGLLLPATATPAARVLLLFLMSWLILLKLPVLLSAPGTMVSWESFAEGAAIAAGGWCLLAAQAGAWDRQHLAFAVGAPGFRAARLLLIAALPMIGLSHFAYQELTASLVPKWLHFPLGWTYLTGAASLAAAGGMAFGILPRLAATLEAAMLWIVTLLVWVPRIASGPENQGSWSEFLISSAIAAGAGLVAGTYREVEWLTSGAGARRTPI